jgi:hypothetical protein
MIALERGDEFGELAHVLNQMAEDLKTLSASASRPPRRWFMRRTPPKTRTAPKASSWPT